MKRENGFTLLSLIIYIIVMMLVIATMSTIITSFYKNLNSFEDSLKEVMKFSKFNTYFLKEIKAKDNEIDIINNNYILFSSGNSFSISNNKIYYNNIQICDGVNDVQLSLGKDGNGLDKSIVYVSITFSNYSKSINYKVESIF